MKRLKGDVIAYHLYDPSRLDGGGYPHLVRTVYVVLDCGFEGIIFNRSAPRSVVVDQRLHEVVLDDAVVRNANLQNTFVCALCGDSFEWNCCPHTTPSLKVLFRQGGEGPLPRTVVFYLQEIGVNLLRYPPETGWQREERVFNAARF